MALPRLGQYQLALQHPNTAFADPELKAATVETNPMGLPKPISGGFALTYHLTNGRHEWAVRCFHKEASGLEQRYAAIARAIGSGAGGPFVPAAYVAGGIMVDGAWHPITKMPWLRSVPINRYIEANLAPPLLDTLADRFRALAAGLRARGIAHGDLQHGNILVDPAGGLKLVDYDGMFVPALAGMNANESGHVNYQHAGRAGQFDAEVDRFSTLVIYVALKALAARPTLWATYSNGENLLFRRGDFDEPRDSKLFADLLAVPELRPVAERLRAVCVSPYTAVPLLDDFLAGAFRPSSRPAAPAPAPRRQHDVLPASDIAGLLGREGDVITVVGKVTGTREGWTRYGRPYLFVSLDGNRTESFTLVLWSQALNLFAQVGQRTDAYKGRWVRVSGLVTVYRTGRSERPQMTVNMPTEMQVLTEAEARAQLLPPPARIAPSTRPVRVAEAATLNRLYGPQPQPGPPPVAAQAPSAARTTTRSRRRAASTPARSPRRASPRARTRRPAGRWGRWTRRLRALRRKLPDARSSLRAVAGRVSWVTLTGSVAVGGTAAVVAVLIAGASLPAAALLFLLIAAAGGALGRGV